MDTVNIHYVIDENISAISTTMFYEGIDEEEFQNVYFEVVVNNQHIQSKPSSSMEYAIKYLQKGLPDDITIACCQSCRYGNFNPYGNMENEIFCLKDKTLQSRWDVVEIFSEPDSSFHERSRKLLDICTGYKPISSDEIYSYNDWEVGLKKGLSLEMEK